MRTAAKPRTWEITDIDGRNPRTVTLAQYLEEIEAAQIAARANAIRMYGAEFVAATARAPR